MDKSPNQQADITGPDPDHVERLAVAIRILIRELLVVGRAGKPAEGLLPFNPLYFHFLGNLLEAGALRPSELAERLGVARSTLSTASKALQRRGLLQQKKDPNDGRAQIIELSKDGLKVAHAIQRQDEQNMRLLLSQLSPDERGQVLNVMETLATKITDADQT